MVYRASAYIHFFPVMNKIQLLIRIIRKNGYNLFRTTVINYDFITMVYKKAVSLPYLSFLGERTCFYNMEIHFIIRYKVESGTF